MLEFDLETHKNSEAYFNIGASLKLDVEKHKSIDAYFSNGTNNKLPFYDNSGQKPCFYWKLDSKIVSREPDGEEYVWKGYTSPDFLARDIKNKVIEVSQKAFERLSSFTFCFELKSLQIEKVAFSKASCNIWFTLDNSFTFGDFSKDYLDFVLKVPSSITEKIEDLVKDYRDFFFNVSSNRNKKTIEYYIKPKMEKLQKKNTLKYYKAKDLFKKESLKLDFGLRIFNKKDSEKSLLFSFPESVPKDVDCLLSLKSKEETVGLIKTKQGSYFFVVKENEQWEFINKVWVISPLGILLDNESMDDITSSYRYLELLEFERSDDNLRALFFLNVKTSTIDPNQIICFLDYGTFAVKSPEGFVLYLENPYCTTNENRFTVLPIPLTPNVQFKHAKYDPNQHRSNVHKCLISQAKMILDENDQECVYSKCFKLLGKKDGAPLVFLQQWPSATKLNDINDIENQKKPLKQLLNRIYCWHSNQGDLIFFEYKDNKPIWKIHDTKGKIYTPEVEFSEDIFPNNLNSVPILDSLRLEFISPDKRKIKFKIENQISFVNQKSLVSPSKWNLTMIVDGPSPILSMKHMKFHTRAYLQTPANVIEIHLTKHGLLVREITQLEIDKKKKKKKIKRIGDVVEIEPSAKFINQILKDFDDDNIRLKGLFENCAAYVVQLFKYAEKPFAVDNLHPLDLPFNPLIYTSSINSKNKNTKIHEMQEVKIIAKCSQGNITLIVKERKNARNFSYYVYCEGEENTKPLFKQEQEGFKYLVDSFTANSEGFHLILHRTGMFPSTIKKTFKFNHQKGES